MDWVVSRACLRLVGSLTARYLDPLLLTLTCPAVVLAVVLTALQWSQNGLIIQAGASRCCLAVDCSRCDEAMLICCNSDTM
jgi:hypothetical protein